MSTEFYWIAVAVVTVLSAARLTRLAVADDFPPVKFFRDIAYDWFDKGPKRLQWQIITWCAYCAAFWLVAFVVGWGVLAHVYGHPPNENGFSGYAENIWWAVNGSLAGSYLASIIVRFDGDTSDDDDGEGES
jgi:hypothetical protein